MNRVFGDRADELIIHGGEAATELRPRKPDRVYGLQQTRRFTKVLEDIMTAVQDRVSQAIQITPFDNRTDPIIFPFLVSEAKTERGDSFDACERQTAFPIWKMLVLQEDLEKETRRLLSEQGGPLVWFLSNRGEDWRVYVCYTNISDSESRTCYVSAPG